MAEAIRRLSHLPFMPHGMCYLWDPRVVWLHVISDSLIAVAYLAIPLALIYFVRRRRDIPFDWMFWCFAIFIAACGATHAMEAWNVWHANYLIEGGVKAVTALASIPTALLLVRLIPQALAVPSPEQLQRSEERFRMAAKSAKMFAYEWNVATDVVVRSGQWATVLGVDEAAGLTGRQLLSRIHPDDREAVVTAIAALTPQNPDLQITYRMIRPDGAVFWVERNSRAHFDDRGKMLRIVGMVADITERKQTEEALLKLAHELVRAQDNERRSVARDLHESAGQTLAALKMTLMNLEDCLGSGGNGQLELAKARGLADEAVREVRVISYLMHPPLLDDAGLGPALRWYARGFADRSGIDVQLHITDDLGRHPQEIETTVFRIVQEALTNVYRHSGSRTALIRLALQDHQILLEIQDYGCGLPFPASRTEHAATLGVGIAGIRERVNQLRGTFHMQSAPGTGTTVHVVLPLESSP